MARAALTIASTQLPPCGLGRAVRGWVRASKEGRSAAPRPLPNEVDGPLSLFVDFHGITEGGLLGILRTSYGQLSPGPGSGGSNYVFAKGFLANGSGSEDARNETLSASSQKAREEQQACMWGHRGVYVGSQVLQNCCGGVALGRTTTLLHTGR